MAGIVRRPKGKIFIQFYWQGKRHTWRPERIRMSTAKRYKANLESLLKSVLDGEEPCYDVKHWVEGLPKQHKALLQRLGLANVSKAPTTLKALAEHVIDKDYANAKANTRKNMQRALGKLVEYFGDREVETICKAELDEWRNHLLAEDYAPATASFYMKKSRTLFNRAVDYGVILSSPFTKVEIPPETNEDRIFYVDHDSITKLMRVCSPEWQAAVCLCRFAGLRFPSDVFSLTWERVNFDLGRIVAYRQKTSRDVAIPMMPEVRHTLEYLWDLRTDSDEKVFTTYQRFTSDRAAYQQLRRLVIRAGMEPWERLTNNLRVSWGVDLKLAGLPAETIAKWMDHTSTVHARHYDLIADEEFTAASKIDSGVFGEAKVKRSPEKVKP